MSKQEDLQNIVNGLRAAVPDIHGALVGTVDGLAVSHHVSSGDPNRVAAMSATALGLGKRVADTLGIGEMAEISIVGANGRASVYAVGQKGVLAVVANAAGNVGLIGLESRDAAAKIAAVL